MRSDRIGRDIIFHKPYRVIVPKEGEEDSHIPIQQNGTTWYTDGSKTEQSTGAGATNRDSDCEISINLGNYATVFQAEITAISACAQEMTRRSYTNKRIQIISDSQAALKALGAVEIHSQTSGRPDEVIAAETLENYKRCNNSFIQGVFQAQYRSSLSCSRCRTQSNTFDPFQCISVQLPQFHKHSIYVTVLYTSQQPRQVQIGLNLPSGATVSELRDILESDTSIERANMLITEIGDSGFLRTFTDVQSVGVITEIDPIYCIEVAQLKDVHEDTTSAYVLLCWINVLVDDNDCQRFDPAWNDNEPPCYLEPDLEHPLFMEAVDQALALCSEDGGPPHVKLVLEWTPDTKAAVIADDNDFVEEHSSVKMLRAQALHGGAPLTLEECLRDYTEAETLTDAWRCPHCQQYQPVVKTLDVWSLPDILIVHFKRFRQHSLRGGNSTKLTTMVDFPVYGFDMTPHLAHKRNTLNRNDTLADTEGSMLIGNGWSPWKRAESHRTPAITCHYTAACKNPYDNQWYLYDDAKVMNLSKQSNDISSLLVNNSAYILFYQKRNGIYVGSSSNSSSAASTSSVGSSQDHWVSRMPRFVPPKAAVVAPKPPPDTRVTETRPQTEVKPAFKEDIFEDSHLHYDCNDSEESPNNAVDEVALRNSQNTLHSSHTNVRKSLENRSTNTPENVKNSSSSPALSHLSVNGIQAPAEPKKPVYTTSIYINSSGDVDVTTTCDRSPVLSSHRVNAAAQDEEEDEEMSLRKDEGGGKKGDVIYTTTAAVHRHSDICYPSREPLRSHLNFMSPQPTRKLHTLPQSM
ncbi:hypothetical protein NQ318_014094 [Aromia moschata]|uniref:ubiquitinyl hydrolase 1 n=1 Tax=Aromia moschata TaxID=1265417 RepID=A0AAV8YXA2_9CUCU|nr:hypothetical protein NQ318_014094 [Aromia moschata]